MSSETKGNVECQIGESEILRVHVPTGKLTYCSCRHYLGGKRLPTFLGKLIEAAGDVVLYRDLMESVLPERVHIEVKELVRAEPELEDLRRQANVVLKHAEAPIKVRAHKSVG